MEAGEVNRDRGDTQEKAESIIRCIEYSHSNLATEAQQLLLCLAPFNNIIQQNSLVSYSIYLRQQPALSALPFEQWSMVLREAQNGGVLRPDQDVPDILNIQPVFPYFLRCRLEAPEQVEKKQAIEAAFCQLYQQVGKSAHQLLSSQSQNERQDGLKLVRLEYENLNTALHLALKAQAPVIDLFQALAVYLNTIKEEQKSLKLSQETLESLQAYSPDKLVGSAGLERIRIIGTLANQQTNLKQYEEAEASYGLQLEFLSQLKDIDEEERSSRQAITYHDLGNLTFDHSQWQKAEDYYKKSLDIKIGLDNPRSLALTYEQLGNALRRQGKLQEAEGYSKLALQVFVQLNDQRPNQLSQAGTYLNLGTEAQLQQHRQRVAILDPEALRISREFNNPDNMAKPYQHLDTLTLQQQQWQLAESHYQWALASIST